MRHNKLLEALEALQALQKQGIAVIRSNQLSRTYRERLCKQGFLQKVINGWYIPSRPDDSPGDTTAWYTSFWQFCQEYLDSQNSTWCLSSEQSIFLHVENWTVPKQLLIRSPSANNNVTALMHNTSLLVVRAAMPTPENQQKIAGLCVYSLPAALCACSESFFQQYPTEVKAALLMISDASSLLHVLLKGGHSVVAGRLVGAFRYIGKEAIANDILAAMTAADYRVQSSNPFKEKADILIPNHKDGPHVNRMRLMWQAMRPVVMTCFPNKPGLPKDREVYLNSIRGLYTSDAYHSLSIEGYQVTQDLIERVRSGIWDPSKDCEDRNALAARGYWQAFNHVQDSIRRILSGDNPGEVAREDHSSWYRELFTPNVAAGLIEVSHLAGYRNASVFIRQSMHIPPSCDAARELMSVFFELLAAEAEPAVRAVLGHFMFVYIHPYMDGNGRIGRFLMNAMFASGGYPWVVVPLERRQAYMQALEQASVEQDIQPFAELLATLQSSG